MEDGHLVHHVSRSLRLLKRSPFLTHGQLSVEHHQVILAISQCQLTGQLYVLRTLIVSPALAIMECQMLNRFFGEIAFENHVTSIMC
jgi:hypothetical protein